MKELLTTLAIITTILLVGCQPKTIAPTAHQIAQEINQTAFEVMTPQRGLSNFAKGIKTVNGDSVRYDFNPKPNKQNALDTVIIAYNKAHLDVGGIVRFYFKGDLYICRDVAQQLGVQTYNSCDDSTQGKNGLYSLELQIQIVTD